jgi:hypothetical protein
MISAQIKDDDQSHRWLQNETYWGPIKLMVSKWNMLRYNQIDCYKMKHVEDQSNWRLQNETCWGPIKMMVVKWNLLRTNQIDGYKLNIIRFVQWLPFTILINEGEHTEALGLQQKVNCENLNESLNDSV